MQKVLLYEEFWGEPKARFSAQRLRAGPVAVIRLPPRPQRRTQRVSGRPAPHAKPVAQLFPAQPELTHADCAQATGRGSAVSRTFHGNGPSSAHKLTPVSSDQQRLPSFPS